MFPLQRADRPCVVGVDILLGRICEERHAWYPYANTNMQLLGFAITDRAAVNWYRTRECNYNEDLV